MLNELTLIFPYVFKFIWNEIEYNTMDVDERVRVLFICDSRAHHYYVAEASELARNKTKVSTISNEY